MRQIDTVRRLSRKFDQALEQARNEVADYAPAVSDSAVEAVHGNRSLESLGGNEAVAADALEAIILEKLRPAYLILEDQIEIRGDYDHVDVVTGRKQELESIARNVGRVDLFHHPTHVYAGTGWVIDDDMVVTNRHVAQMFAEAAWAGGYQFRRGAFDETMEARLDFVRQHDNGNVPRRRAEVREILYVAGPGEPDIAILRIVPNNDLAPLDLFTGSVEDETPIAAIGYPAKDGGRNDPLLMEKIFKGIYDVKRFAPGLATGHDADGVLLRGDYTSLGGNSGSAIIALDSGRVVGLHFAGTFKEANYSVASDIVAAARARLKTLVVVGELPAEEAPTSPATSFADRKGYDPNFLGDGDLRVPLPGLGPWEGDIAPVSDDSDRVLKYTHFSVVQSLSRRLPLFTAVNIDGEKSFKLKRKGTWKLDGRLADEHQIGNELYFNNPIDRGHMVRRRDPGWGNSRKEAQQAEIDTFHYTNSAPQHEDLNQKDWVGLEDYILEASETRNFKVSVFTGPVFRDDDRTLRSQDGADDIPIPEEFWKIAVIVNENTGKLSATGYVLTQGKMIRNLVEAAFLYGQYETYQVKIAKIEAETGLRFGALKDVDPMGGDMDDESPFQDVARRIGGPADLVLTKPE